MQHRAASESSAQHAEGNELQREPLSVRFQAVRHQTEDLSAPLAVEDCIPQSMTEASPVRWHLAHTTWFFEEFVLARYQAGYARFHPGFGFLFNSYYNAVGERTARDERGLMTRPTLAEVGAYRQHVTAAILQYLDVASDLGAAAPGSELAEPLRVLEIGLHHEQQHQELILTDVKHLLSRNPLAPVYSPRAGDAEPRGHPGPIVWIPLQEGIHWIGHDGPGFAFDNESPRHRALIEACEIADRLVTRREYLEFMLDGGYERPELWLDEGWAAARRGAWKSPLYWIPGEHGGSEFTLSGLLPVDLDEPVAHVSFYEADAYARWMGVRLPREEEWEAAISPQPIAGNFAESRRFHPVACGPSDGRHLRQSFGDVWEWTASPYSPYPGYRPESGALGEYNGKFMCSQFVLRGGSCATPLGHIRPTYRNFFYPDARWQFAGIRLARDLR